MPWSLIVSTLLYRVNLGSRLKDQLWRVLALRISCVSLVMLAGISFGCAKNPHGFYAADPSSVKRILPELHSAEGHIDEAPSDSAISYLSGNSLVFTEGMTRITGEGVKGRVEKYGEKLWNRLPYELDTFVFLQITLAVLPDDHDKGVNFSIHVAQSLEQAERLMIHSWPPQRQFPIFADGDLHTYTVPIETIRGSQSAGPIYLLFSPMDVPGTFHVSSIELVPRPDYALHGPARGNPNLQGTSSPSLIFGRDGQWADAVVNLGPNPRMYLATGSSNGASSGVLEIQVRDITSRANLEAAWETLARLNFNNGSWKYHVLNLTEYSNHTIEVRFLCHAADSGEYYVANPMVVDADLDASLILLYVVDALRADHLSIYGYERPTSPNIDRFARTGTVFERAFAQASWTKPSVVSLLTGLAPDAHGVDEHGRTLSREIPTVATVLKASGFVTVSIISNLHAGSPSGLHRDFDVLINQDHPSSGGRDAKTMHEVLSRVLHRYAGVPLFIYFHLIDPHLPYEDPVGFRELFGEGDGDEIISAYDGEIRFVDQSFSNVVTELQNYRRLERSLTIFTADHGENFRSGLEVPHGATLENAETHVPLIVVGLGILPSGQRVQEVVQLVDIVPTLADLCGLGEIATDGRSLLPLIYGNAQQDRYAFSHSSNAYQQRRELAVWYGQYKLYATLDGEYAFVDFRSVLDDGSVAYAPAEELAAQLSAEQLEAFEHMRRVLQNYRNRPTRALPIETAIYDDEAMERLRALGYVR